MKYYFLASYLPEIHRDDIKIRISLGNLLEERFHILESDWKEIELLLLGRDIFVLEKLLAGKTVSMEHTVHSLEFWQEQIKSPKEGPEFVLDYLRMSDLATIGFKDIDRLYWAYFEYVLEATANDFMRDYYMFQQNLRNVVAALRARQKGLDPSEYLIGEGEVVRVLSSSTAEDFGLSMEFPWIESLIKAETPHERQAVVDEIQWDYLDQHAGPDPFDFRVILAYLLKLEILERQLALSELEGMEKVRRLGGL
jgi:vacuolar-type H+-ATPase subunit C/Vma6